MHGGDEILDPHRVVVVALEIQVHALAEILAPEDGGHHADDLGALVVDGGGVEIVDRQIGFRLHGMCQRSRVLAELPRAQGAHVADALHRAAALVGGEFLVAIDRQAFLQRQLEPVAAGDAVAGPVVEILVRDHRLDPLVVAIGGGVRAGQDILGVEDVEALVLHRPHVEVGDGGDVEHVEVVFQAEHVLVPAHGFFQGAHGMGALVLVAAADVDAEIDAAARACGEMILHRNQIARHQREQVAGFRMRIGPGDAVPPVAEVMHRAGIAVRQQHGNEGLVGGDGDGVARHHVGPVGEIGDAAEAFRLALGEITAARDIQAAQFGVGGGGDAGFDLQHAAVGHRVDGQDAVLDAVGVRGEGRAVAGEADQGQRLAVQAQGFGGEGFRVAVEGEAGDHPRRMGVEVERQGTGVDQEGRGAVCAEQDGLGGHGASFTIRRPCSCTLAARPGNSEVALFHQRRHDRRQGRIGHSPPMVPCRRFPVSTKHGP